MSDPSAPSSSPLLEFALPVHNEAESIAATLTELHEFLANTMHIPHRLVVSEDGSSDNSVEVLANLQNNLPMLLLTEPSRRGYSQAVLAAFRATSAPYVAFIDGDGQCDPRDFARFWPLRDDYDLIVGYRNPRQDHWIRLLMSGAFGKVYGLFFRVPFRDPSCPYLLVKRAALETILRGTPGILQQGFWWEFVARATSAGLKTCEVPVNHRIRVAGGTQVYRPAKALGIGQRHIRGLFQLRRQLKQLDGDTLK
jgi:dolichol-phosphate mannosyltransferase